MCSIPIPLQWLSFVLFLIRELRFPISEAETIIEGTRSNQFNPLRNITHYYPFDSFFRKRFLSLIPRVVVNENLGEIFFFLYNFLSGFSAILRIFYLLFSFCRFCGVFLMLSFTWPFSVFVVGSVAVYFEICQKYKVD